MSRKNIIDRVLNRPSESRGSQPSGLLLVLFVEAKRIKPFPFSETFEVLQTSIQRTQVAVSGKPHHGISRGVEAPPLPVHAKRVCRLLRKHSQAAKPLYGVPGREHLPAFEKAGQKYGVPPPTCTRESCVPLASRAFPGG